MPIPKNLIPCVLMLVVSSVASGQQLKLTSLGSEPEIGMSILHESTVAASTPANLDVNHLPNDFFGPAKKVEASNEQVRAAYAEANLWVLAGLASMLGVGMGITGLCIMKKKPKPAPVRVMIGT